MKAHCLPFSQIPHTTRLFADFLTYLPDVQPFYPKSPNLGEWLKEESLRISYDSSRRERVAAILERQNKSWDASPQTLANLARLRKGAAAIVTGQQVGLFGGPMFAIYKALTAVKLAEEATAAGVDAVPVFWLATYDHDLAEVNHVSIPGPDGAPQVLTTPSHDLPGAPVSAVRLGNEILPLVEQAAKLLGESDVTHLLRESYRPGESLGTAFARLYARVFAEWGVIVLDASDGELDRIAEPMFRAAIERADELDAALLARGKALEAAGYHQQVKVTSSSVLLFTMRQGARTPIHRRGNGGSAEFVIGADAAAEKLSQAELLGRISSNPEQFSPNVLLRPIIEDYLLPTFAYTGGAAEAAYFAQAGAVYEALLGRITPIVPRFSATIVEPKIQRLLERHGIIVQDVFTDADALRRQLAEHGLPKDLQAAFDAAKKSLDSHLSNVKEKLVKLDRTLVDAAETARSKIEYQLERLHSQAGRAEAQKSELVTRHAATLSQALYPDKNLQERGVGGVYFLARYGREFLQQLHDAIQPDCHDHQILQL
ncbi:MAG: bacillithiol biosynthesis cysteine-adding enzyme BshC [Candidatus Sulfotelmatobacter sp.]